MIAPSINSLKRLKDSLLSSLDIQSPTDKIKIYNYKGLEIDDADIEYLKDKQILYLALSGKFKLYNFLIYDVILF